MAAIPSVFDIFGVPVNAPQTVENVTSGGAEKGQSATSHRSFKTLLVQGSSGASSSRSIHATFSRTEGRQLLQEFNNSPSVRMNLEDRFMPALDLHDQPLRPRRKRPRETPAIPTTPRKYQVASSPNALRAAASALENEAARNWLKAQGFDPVPDGGAGRHFVGSSPMLTAAAEGNLHMCRWLAAHGAPLEDLRMADDSGWTPMFVACRNGHLHVARWLRSKGAAADLITPSSDRSTPFLAACFGGHMETLRWLHHAGVDVNARDNLNRSPIFMAARQRHVDVCAWLVDVGLSITPEDLEQRPEVSAALVRWAKTRLQAHQVFVANVLFGIHQASPVMSKLAGLEGPRRLIASALGVPTGPLLSRLRGLTRLSSSNPRP